MNATDATILIVARNAAATIQRAVRSATAESPVDLVLVDDWSSDGTAELASAVAPGLRVVRPIEHRTLGFARQAGLDAVRTPFGVWLDADDEFLPGRLERLCARLSAPGAAIASDGVDLHDGETGTWLRRLPIPGFLLRDRLGSRLFERNYLPAIGPVGFRTERIRTLGYDASLHGAEDVDLALRVVASGLRVELVAEIGYRQFAYPTSVSRDRDNQRRMYGRALAKHQYGAVRKLLLDAGWSDAVAAWSLVSMATFREEWDHALDFLSDAERLGGADGRVLEPDGPTTRSEQWRVAFHRGTLESLHGRAGQAVEWLRRANALLPTPEGENNLGVVQRLLGRSFEARGCFERALAISPGYDDAARNATCE